MKKPSTPGEVVTLTNVGLRKMTRSTRKHSPIGVIVNEIHGEDVDKGKILGVVTEVKGKVATVALDIR